MALSASDWAWPHSRRACGNQTLEEKKQPWKGTGELPHRGVRYLRMQKGSDAESTHVGQAHGLLLAVPPLLLVLARTRAAAPASVFNSRRLHEPKEEDHLQSGVKIRQHPPRLKWWCIKKAHKKSSSE